MQYSKDARSKIRLPLEIIIKKYHDCIWCIYTIWRGKLYCIGFHLLSNVLISRAREKDMVQCIAVCEHQMIGGKKKAERNYIRGCLWGFARWLPVKQNNSALVYNTVDYVLDWKGEKSHTLQRLKDENSNQIIWFLKLIQTNTSPWSMQQLKGNVVCCSIIPSKTKDYWS